MRNFIKLSYIMVRKVRKSLSIPYISRVFKNTGDE